MEIKQRLLRFIEYKGISKYKFYQITGLANGFLDGGGSIQSDKCEQIASHFPELNVDWLIMGRGSMMNGAMAYEIDGNQSLILNEPTVPLINFGAVAGTGSSQFSITQDDIQAHYLVPDFHDIQFMIRVQGSSMYPKYTAGDIIACRILNSPSFIQWNKVHVIATKDQGVLVKRIKKGKSKDTYLCVSENPEYDPFEIHLDGFHSIALVVGVIRVE